MTKEYLGLLMDVSMKGNGKMEIQMEQESLGMMMGQYKKQSLNMLYLIEYLDSNLRYEHYIVINQFYNTN